MEIRSLSPRIGAEIGGLDLSEELDPAPIARIRDAFAQHHLLLFRDQHITPEQQRRFAEYFAPTIGTHQARKEDGLLYISNRDPETKVGEGTLPFHSDHTFFEEPDTSVLALYALAVPTVGGDTLWVNAVRAYEDLPPALKERIVGMHALHTYKRADQQGSFTAVHPLARLLPDMGRPVLFVNEFCKDGIVELPGPAGEALMAELFDHLYREETFYRHKWRVGDLIIWDNRVLQHARTDFDPSEARTMRRSTQGVPEKVVEAVPAVS